MQSYYFLLGEKIILPLSTREMFLGIMLLFSAIILFLAIPFAEVNILVSINSELRKHRGDTFILTQRENVLIKQQHYNSDSKSFNLYPCITNDMYGDCWIFGIWFLLHLYLSQKIQA